MSKEPEDPTTSPEPCDPEGTLKEVESVLGRSTKKKYKQPSRWDKYKVFARPEYRTHEFKALMPGRKLPESGRPEPWLEAAIRSGLVEMGSPEKGLPVGDWLEPINGHPPPRMSREALELMWAKGIAEVLAYQPTQPQEKKK